MTRAHRIEHHVGRLLEILTNAHIRAGKPSPWAAEAAMQSITSIAKGIEEHRTSQLKT